LQVEALGEIQLATTLFEDASEEVRHPLLWQMLESFET
jgi:hypothetical protein